MSKTAIILILVAILYVIFLKWAYKYDNPYKLYFVLGKKGSGKTSYLCKLAIEYINKGWIVYTNVQDIRVQGVRIISDITDLGLYAPEANSLLLIDEVSLIWDNRHFKNFKDCTKEFFRLQRHYKCICYLFSQSFDVDKKIRDLSDRMYFCKQIFGRWSWLREVDKNIVITESTAESESRIAENLKFRGIFSWRFLYIPFYSIYFDSFVLPDHHPMPYRVVPEDREIIIHEHTWAMRAKRRARHVLELLPILIKRWCINLYYSIRIYLSCLSRAFIIKLRRVIYGRIYKERRYNSVEEFWKKRDR